MVITITILQMRKLEFRAFPRSHRGKERGGLGPRFLDAYSFHLMWLPELTTLSVDVRYLCGRQRECAA